MPALSIARPTPGPAITLTAERPFAVRQIGSVRILRATDSEADPVSWGSKDANRGLIGFLRLGKSMIFVVWPELVWLNPPDKRKSPGRWGESNVRC